MWIKRNTYEELVRQLYLVEKENIELKKRLIPAEFSITSPSKYKKGDSVNDVLVLDNPVLAFPLDHLINKNRCIFGKDERFPENICWNYEVFDTRINEKHPMFEYEIDQHSTPKE